MLLDHGGRPRQPVGYLEAFPVAAAMTVIGARQYFSLNNVGGHVPTAGIMRGALLAQGHHRYEETEAGLWAAEKQIPSI